MCRISTNSIRFTASQNDGRPVNGYDSLVEPRPVITTYNATTRCGLISQVLIVFRRGAGRQSTRCSSTLCRPRKLLITGRKATSSGPSTAASSSAQSLPPKATARKRHAVLRKHHRQVMPAAAQRFGRAGQRHAGRAQQRPGVALAEGGQPLDLLHRLERERAQRRLDVDEQLRHPLLAARSAWRPRRRRRRESRPSWCSSIFSPAAAA